MQLKHCCQPEARDYRPRFEGEPASQVCMCSCRQSNMSCQCKAKLWVIFVCIIAISYLATVEFICNIHRKCTKIFASFCRFLTVLTRTFGTIVLQTFHCITVKNFRLAKMCHYTNEFNTYCKEVVCIHLTSLLYILLFLSTDGKFNTVKGWMW